MKCVPGQWVDGENFFGRRAELESLETLVRDGNHVLLTGQRRMGKTSIARELGRRLEQRGGWTCAFADLESATRAEDAIAKIEEATASILSSASRGAIASRTGENLVGWGRENFSKIGGVELRKPDMGNWRRRGDGAIRACAEHERRVLLVTDELPILLTRMLRGGGDGPRQDGEVLNWIFDGKDSSRRQVDEFLSWMRGAIQAVEGDSPVVVVSGSIGLQPLARRLGLSDRINHLHPYRLEAWDRNTAVECFKKLAINEPLQFEDGVADAVYDKLGLGIPQHVQLFFDYLRRRSHMQQASPVTKDDVDAVYRDELLGPYHLDHYKSRLRDALYDESYDIATEILSKTANEGVFTDDAQHDLERLWTPKVDDAPIRIADTLDVLEHDGYLESHADGRRFRSRLLRDWWKKNVHGHRAPRAASARRTPR